MRLAATIRSLARQPLFAAVVIISLGLSVGLSTTLYSIIDALLYPTLDVRQPSQLYWLRLYGDRGLGVLPQDRDRALAGGAPLVQSFARFEAVADPVLVEGNGGHRSLNIANVGSGYFGVLGARTSYGRGFLPSDEAAGTSVVVISEALATAFFDEPARAVGASITLDGKPNVVVGVVRGRVDLPGHHISAWRLAPSTVGAPYIRLARVSLGADRDALDRQLSGVARRIGEAGGNGARRMAFQFRRATDPESQLRPLHKALVFATLAILLVACANLANIQVARGLRRRRELALRTALGASRRQLVNHLVAESALLAMCGMLLGLLLAHWGAVLLRVTVPKSVSFLVIEPQWSWRVLVAALVASTVCLILTGLLPALRISRVDPAEMLKSGAGTGASKANRRQYAILAGFEIALALALLSASALTTRGALRVFASGYGYDITRLARGYMSVGVKGPTETEPLVLQLESRMRGLPEVASASAYDNAEFAHNRVTYTDVAGTHELSARGLEPRLVTSSYLRTLGLPIARGRDFEDGERDVPLVIVDERAAAVMWPHSNPIGHQIKLGDSHSTLPFATVIGVAGAATHEEEAGSFIGSSGQVYRLLGHADSSSTYKGRSTVSFMLRSKTEDSRHLPLIVKDAFPEGDAWRIRLLGTFSEMSGLDRIKSISSFLATLFSVFGALGLLLACFGIYGIVAYSVAERRREMGVRIALGAASRHVLSAILRESVIVALSGIAIGLLIARGVSSMLDGIAMDQDRFNPMLFASAAAVLAIAVAASAFLPALTATRIDPAESLRSE
ncbi:MAG: hypothetical protein JWO05_770 [Gemmatimonadetes bacterium]|nr:hypothetical protein [Gemmatimonadota bacterium]